MKIQTLCELLDLADTDYVKVSDTEIIIPAVADRIDINEDEEYVPKDTEENLLKKYLPQSLITVLSDEACIHISENGEGGFNWSIFINENYST